MFTSILNVYITIIGLKKWKNKISYKNVLDEHAYLSTNKYTVIFLNKIIHYLFILLYLFYDCIYFMDLLNKKGNTLLEVFINNAL